jgi:hypothetical protein
MQENHRQLEEEPRLQLGDSDQQQDVPITPSLQDRGGVSRAQGLGLLGEAAGRQGYLEDPEPQRRGGFSSNPVRALGAMSGCALPSASGLPLGPSQAAPHGR